jgi:hypothetical protein
MAFIDRLRLRGENRPPTVAGPWPKPEVDCL